MIYEWKCKECGKVVDIRRPVSDMDFGPVVEDGVEECEHGYDTYVRIISRTSTPFEHLRDAGMLDRTHWHKSNDNWK